MKKITSIAALENLGRVRLSDSFYMRDFLYSEISNYFEIQNFPEDPTMAIEAGSNLCRNLLEPLQQRFGRVAIRSAYRSRAVNEFGNAKSLNCGSNAYNAAHHIWDARDEDGNLGATACIVLPKFADIYDDNGGPASWTELAWWIHDHLPYNSMFFFRKNAAVNLNWRENPERRIDSWTPKRMVLTKSGMENHTGDHSDHYSNVIKLQTN